MSTRDQQQIDALTSLRFFAALAVLLFHSGSNAAAAAGYLPLPLANFFRNGFLGVSFFFVLSGFILTYVYYGRLSPTQGLTAYGGARFARVYPVHLLALLLMVPFVHVSGLNKDLPQFLLLQSWIPFVISDGSWVSNWNMQAWTLSVELFFYLTFPFLLAIFSRLSTSAIVGALAAVMAIIIGLRVSSAADGPLVLFAWMRYVPLPVLRLPEFVYGMLLGALFLRGRIPRAPWLLHGLLLATVLIMSASRSLWVTPVAALLFGGVIALTATSLGATDPLGRLLRSRVLILLGGASYCIYLLQLPVHHLVRTVLDGPYALVGRMTYIPILIAVSIVTFIFYEETLRRWLRGSRRTLVSAQVTT